MSVELLFKFRPLVTLNHLSRLIESLNDNSLYFPTYEKLNDPLESSGYIIELSGYAGRNIFVQSDDEDSIVKAQRAKMRILSLSKYCFSPSMWAYYANEFNGVCIGYWKKHEFLNAKEITYITQSVPAKMANHLGEIEDADILGKEIVNSFFYKHNDWEHEGEWRIVSDQEESYFRYNPECLSCIIIGHNVNKEIRDIIVSRFKNVPTYKTKVGYRSFGINLLPVDYEIKLDGTPPPFIKNNDELLQDLNKRKL